MHMSACELRDYARVRCASVSPDGSVRASVASNRHTTGCMQSHNTHICYVGVVVRSCPWWHYLSSTTLVPTAHGCETTSSRGGCIRCGTVRAKDLLNTYADGTNTGVRERSLVQSHVALHHIHQHSALSSLQTTLASAKHQSASQKRTSPEDTWLVAHCFLLSFSLVLKKISSWIKEKKGFLWFVTNKFQQSRGLFRTPGYVKTNIYIYG